MGDKVRLNVYISRKNYKHLDEMASMPGVSKTAIFEDALSAYFNPDHVNKFDELVLERMNQFDLKQGEIERDQAVILEILGQFVLYWLTLTEPMRAGERDDAQRQGAKRYDYFLDQVGRRMVSQAPLSVRVLGELVDQQELS